MRTVLTGLLAGTTYNLQLRAVGEDGAVSEWSRTFQFTTVTDTVPPKAPTNVAGSMSGTSFILTWDAVTESTDNTPAYDLAGYDVLVASDTNAATRVFRTTNTRFELPLETNRSIFGTPQANIKLSVRSIDKANNTTGYSTPVTQTNAAPANVTGLTVASLTNSISASWTANTDTDLVGYVAHVGTTAGFTPSGANKVWEGTATSFVYQTIQYSTDLWVKVYAVDVFGTLSAAPASAGPVRPSNPVSVDTTAPPTPTGLAAVLSNATDGKTAKAVVTWAAVTDTDNDLAEYIIDYKPSAETGWDTAKVDYEKTSLTLIGLLPYTNYDFRIRAGDFSANLSTWSSTLTKTATTNSAPGTVTGVSVTGGKDSLTIKWTPSAEADVANGAGVYLVDIATNNTFSTGLLSYRTGEASLTVTGLAQGTTYYVRVKAVDSLGAVSTNWSTTASAVTGTLNTFKHTVSATAPSNPSTGDIWMDTTSGFEKQWDGSTWVNTGNASISYVDSQFDSSITTYSNEYAVNSSETVAPVSGWSTSTPTRTPGTFVWFRTTVTKGDGTTSTTSPALLTGNTGAQGDQGIPGNPGADGVSLYTWVKYADTPTTGMSDDPTGKAYIGLAYNKTTATESTTYTDYQWALIKGEQGIPGTPGDDGVTTYTWVKYADNATGTVGMSDTPTGKAYIGLAFNKTTATESTTPTDYAWSLIKGADGAPAAVVSLTATSQVLTSPAAGGATNPATSTVTGTATNTTITAWTYSVDGAAFSATVPAGVSRTNNVVTITGSTMTARTIAVKMADANGVSDTLTVAKVLDGATGGEGTPGTPGADGYTVILSNEAQVFAGSTSAALAGSATSQVIAYKGATQMAATIGTITGQVTGLTTAITNNGTTTAGFTVTVTTSLTTQSGVLTVPITVDGKSFTKTFAWSVSRTGATGNTGDTGKGITSVTPYFYQIATGSAAPAKPVASPPPAPWTTTEPNYVPNTELYRTERIIYTDATFAYTDVSKVSSYAAAVTAIATADGKNKIIRSTSVASGTTGFVAGDLWWQVDGSNNVIGQWRYSGSAWISEQITSAVITNLDVNKLTAGSGFITTLSIASGGAIQSAGYTSGGTSGFHLSNTGLTIKGTGNTVDASVLKGGTITGTTINVGAGGVLNVDSTASIKSNNYSAGSTGYSLGSSGLEVNDGTVDAKTLKTNSAVIGELIIGRSADSAGTIRSFDYSAGTAGWKIGKGLFEINQGTIKAAALQIQNSQNLMLPEYASFEFTPSFYTPGVGIYQPASATLTLVTSGGKYGTQYLQVRSTSASATNTYLAKSVTDYNLRLEPSTTYIISAWVKTGTVASTVRMRVKNSAGTFSDVVTQALGASGAWQRIQGTYTTSAGNPDVAVLFTVDTATSGAGVDIDGVQVEQKIAGLNTASVWTPPGVTSADGGILRTGEIRSTATTTVNGVSQPAWFINLSGGAQFGNANVRGSLIIGPSGADTDAGQSFVSSGNYVANTTGWKIDSAGNIYANSGYVRGDVIIDGTLAVPKLATGEIAAGVRIIAGDSTGSHAEMTDSGFYAYTYDPDSGLTREAVRMGTATNDMFAITDSTGETIASISETGLVSGKGASFQETRVDSQGYPNGVEIYGTEFIDYINGRSRIVAVGSGGNYSEGPFTTQSGFYEISWDAEPNKIYRLHAQVPHVRCDTRGALGVWRLHVTTDGTSPTTSTAVLESSVVAAQAYGTAGADATKYTSPQALEVVGSFSSSSVTQVRALVSFAPYHPSGQNWYIDALNGTSFKRVFRMWVEDLGYVPDENTMQFNDGSSGSTSSKKTYVTTWQATNSASYTATGGAHYYSPQLVQGYYSGTNGDSYGFAVFGGNGIAGETSKTVSSALSGATLLKAEAYLYANHWYYNSGGTAFLRPYNSTTITNTVPSGTVTTSANWPKPGGRWVTLSGATTSIRGFSVGKANSTNYLYYGRFNAYNASSGKPLLRLTYTR